MILWISWLTPKRILLSYFYHKFYIIKQGFFCQPFNRFDVFFFAVVTAAIDVLVLLTFRIHSAGSMVFLSLSLHLCTYLGLSIFIAVHIFHHQTRARCLWAILSTLLQFSMTCWYLVMSFQVAVVICKRLKAKYISRQYSKSQRFGITIISEFLRNRKSNENKRERGERIRRFLC